MADENNAPDLAGLAKQLIKARWLIAGIVLLAAALGVGYALLATPIYQADALVQLEEKSGNSAMFSPDMSALFGDTPQTVTEIEILKSRMILGAVIDNLRLEYSATTRRLPLVGGFLARVELPDPHWRFLRRFAWHDDKIRLEHLEIPARLTGQDLVLTSLGGGRFRVQTGRDVLTGQLGETLESGDFSLRVDQLDAPEGREFILKRQDFGEVIRQLRARLSIGERGKNSSILQLALRGEDRGEITRILDEVINVYLLQNLNRSVAEVDNSLKFIRTRIPDAQGRLQAAERALSDYQLAQGSVDLSFETRAMLEESVKIETKLSELALQEQELQKRFTPSHPLYQTLLDNRRQLQERLAEIRKQTADLPSVQQEMLRLTQDLEVARQTYLQLVSRTQELEVAKAGTLGSIRVIDPAMAAILPVAPDKKVIVVLATVLGAIVAVSTVLLRNLATRGVETAAELEDLGVPVYASVAKVGNGVYTNDKRGDAKILAKESPASLAIEALRSLRTSLHFGMLEAKTNLLMITSSRPGEGKSFLAVNLATVMAQAGQNVCLVDADIRRGYLRHFFGIPKAEPGLTDVLAGDIAVEEVIRQDPDSGLYFIPAGKYPPNPSELLMHRNFADLVTYLDQRFDIVILDTPPLLAVTDPVIIGKYVGMILLASRHLVTQLSEVKASLKVIENNGLKVTGTVLNVYDAKKGDKGAGGYHYEYTARD